MSEISKEVFSAINEMFSCLTPWDHFFCYQDNIKYLRECSFLIYSDEYGQKLPKYMQSNYDNDFAVIEIGCANNFYVIDYVTNIEMIKVGKSDLFFDTCIELDTQAVSYLKNIFIDPNNVLIPQDKLKLFSYLSQKDINYSCLPYMLENSRKLTNSNYEKCYYNLRSYEYFKNFNFNEYDTSNSNLYNCGLEDILISTDKNFNLMRSEIFKEFLNDFYDIQQNIYCLLLKTASIEFSNSKKSAKNKIRLLYEFINNELGVFPERETAICYYYFDHNPKTNKFFKKMTKNSASIFDSINSMAWDLTHIRFIERLYNLKPISKVRYSFHPLLTYDNGLKEILQLYPVSKLAMMEEYVLPFFEKKFIEICPESQELLFSEENKMKRKNIFQSNKTDIRTKILNLEKELDSYKEVVSNLN